MLLLTGLVCPKIADFLFVKTRRFATKIFYEGEWEKYVVLGEGDTAMPVELRKGPDMRVSRR